MFVVISTTVSAAVASGATITMNYPAPYNAGDFYNSTAHVLNVRGHQTTYNNPTDFTVAFNQASLVVTYNGTTAIPANTVVQLQAEIQGQDDRETYRGPNSLIKRAVQAPIMLVNLGMPTTVVTTAVAAAQAVAGAANLTLNGTLATAGVVTFDQARAVQMVSSNAGDTTQTAAITGTDEYSVAMHETLTFNGTTVVTGKKAWKTITAVAISAVMTGNASMGNSTTLGIPIYLPEASAVCKESLDGVTATAGTLVAADRAKATATTGDVRGTYVPNSAPNSARVFQLYVANPDPQFLGVTQF